MTEERTETVKLNRTDVARLVALQVQEQANHDVGQSVQATIDAREAFHREVRELAVEMYDEQVSAMMAAAGLPGVVASARCTYKVHPGESCADVAQVVFSDSERGYDGRCMVTVDVLLTDDLVALRNTWESCLKLERIAADRDRRMSQISKDVRDKIIKAALADEGGPELLAAAKRVAAVVTIKMQEKGT